MAGDTGTAEPTATAEPSPTDVEETSDAPEESPTAPVTTDDSAATTEDVLALSIEGWVESWAEDGADLLVVGDGYSNLRSQWVHGWADEVAGERSVQIRHWGEAADIAFVEPDVLSEGEGPALSIWSAGRAGSTIEAAAERVGLFVDEADGVDAVLVSLGRSSGDEDIPDALDALLEAVDGVDEELPVLVVVGPEGLYEDGVGDAILGWAEDNEDRVAVLDLRPLTPEEANAEEWATAFQEALDAG